MENHDNIFISADRAAAAETEAELCCCEYYNRENERFHILECCCNCKDFDQVFDRLICCRRIDPSQLSSMLLTFQDRLRFPWKGGAKKISLAPLIPIPAIPLLLGLAAINYTMAVIISFITTTLFLNSFWFLRHNSPRTKLFFMWSLCSTIYIIILFETTVPLMEVLPEENFVLVFFVATSLFCFYTCKKKALLNHVAQSTVSADELPDITEEQTTLLLEADESNEADHNQPNICESCRKYVQPRTFHCIVCKACILRRDHHSFWLDCCIGEWNHRYYFMALLFGVLGLFFLSYLSLTAVCHPILMFRVFGVPVMLPDDCSDVFDQYDFGIAFVASLYSLLIGLFMLIGLFIQCYYISKGITYAESIRGRGGNRKTITSNWRSFFF